MSPLRLSLLGLLAASTGFANDDVAIKINKDTQATSVKAKTYEATVSADGFLSSLLVGGKEFLLAKDGIPRGAYLYQHGKVALPEVSKPNDTTVLAKGDAGSLKYEFGARSVKVTAACAKDTDMFLYIALDSGVTAVMDDAGGAAKTPAQLASTKFAWFADKHRLGMDFADARTSVFPWGDDKIQIASVKLNEGDSRTVVLEAGEATSKETAAVGKLEPAK